MPRDHYIFTVGGDSLEDGEKPRFSLRSALGLIGAAGVGVVIGRAVP